MAKQHPCAQVFDQVAGPRPAECFPLGHSGHVEAIAQRQWVVGGGHDAICGENLLGEVCGAPKVPQSPSLRQIAARCEGVCEGQSHPAPRPVVVLANEGADTCIGSEGTHRGADHM
eukprot:scaffold12489_cov145-Isochrysis_galbana.AAC.5